MEVSKEDLAQWMRNEVTVEFFDRINGEVDDMAGDIYSLLSSGDTQQASTLNTRRQQLIEVQGLYKQMMEDAK